MPPPSPFRAAACAVLPAPVGIATKNTKTVQHAVLPSVPHHLAGVLPDEGSTGRHPNGIQ